MSSDRKIGLALGGGGAKSFAHLGIIKTLQENNIPIDFLATCSGGSIIGSLIACGIPIEDIIKEFYLTVKKVNWLRPKINSRGFFSQQNIKDILHKFCENKRIENLQIPIGIVATNLNEGCLHVFTEGNLADAVCASSALPGIYQPVEINNKLYIDGAIMNSVPADICRERVGKVGLVISVSLDEKLNVEKIRNNTFGIVYRSLYIPIMAKRREVIMKNSDVNINVFEGRDFNFSNWKDTLRFYSESKMREFYLKGRKEAIERIDEINKLVKH